MKITFSKGGSDLSDLAEDLNDLLADLEDFRDEAQEQLDEIDNQKETLRAAILKVDEALRSLSEAADMLEPEE